MSYITIKEGKFYHFTPGGYEQELRKQIALEIENLPTDVYENKADVFQKYAAEWVRNG